MPTNPSKEPKEDPIISPFADTESPSLRKKRKHQAPLWIALGLILLVAAGIAGYFLVHYLNDPLRTLEPFPTSKYMEGYKALAGSKFRANLRVENDLGWKEGIGRLMVFSLQDDLRPIVVMVPHHYASIYFTKGQAYEGELEVKEGGLIYANSIRKD